MKILAELESANGVQERQHPLYERDNTQERTPRREHPMDLGSTLAHALKISHGLKTATH